MCIGLVVGWITHRTLRRKEGAAALPDIATIIDADGGAAVTALFDDKRLFGAYRSGSPSGSSPTSSWPSSSTEKSPPNAWMGD